ncbi:bifunctional cobalt-precorrin-7 (C(5))-methyltransferase/cobalt-precorrin-6B (C(15))-methyltransferase [Devosia psychrophila]|uniref:Precorrin-6Y C5,15-methyltransferase (Decarboxylating) n=1 Tax=Devosia psychrophila TaxID=728005 RepID=A0A0F5Q137_9HYPH|nr:bifunctional cobalt-precorrin-7 (C(5))-methyltransferase/cobalt-precorrin-6B (C(15))-methyltransferase [Devosia psychrophila]KKC33794.1 precorrin-6Y methyltransferase [Devosia psychrophila]SFC46497.1 precorrin-6Y C5,15-methyltransferase (decarboxylating) [Devosia psychrophila]
MSWLSIVGIGEDGVDGLGEAAKRAVVNADYVFGGARHLELASALSLGESRPWLTPFSQSIEAILALRGKAVCVLASGDPMHFGVGATLSRQIKTDEITVYPHPSSFSLAAALLGWPLQEAVTLSLHGRPIELLRPHLHAGVRIIALTSDEHGPAAIAKLLAETGFGLSIVTVLEALGGPEETMRSHVAMSFALTGINPLNVVAISVVALPNARILPLTPGLDDSLFEHDGQITKREIRALSLSALAPRRGETLWDIGSGSGSIAIEWMLADPSLRAIAIEANPERATRIVNNMLACGVPDLRLIIDKAPTALYALEPPNAIFIGGGGTDDGVLETAINTLRPGGRIVVNAVTLELEALLISVHSKVGGSLTRIAISRADAVGSMTGWRPAMPITQWAWTKP